MRPFTPKNVALDGSMKFTFIIRSAFGKENPRSITALTTLNCVVTAAMPMASTKTASAQKALSLTRMRSPMRTSCVRLSKAMLWFRKDDGRAVLRTLDELAAREFHSSHIVEVGGRHVLCAIAQC